MQAVMILRQSEPTWAEAKKQLGDTNFIKQLVDFDKDNMSDKVGISLRCDRVLSGKSLCMGLVVSQSFMRRETHV